MRMTNICHLKAKRNNKLVSFGYCGKIWNKSLLVSHSKWLYILFPRQVTLYHYTDKEGAIGIAKSKKIKASTDTEKDAKYGPGKLVSFLPLYSYSSCPKAVQAPNLTLTDILIQCMRLTCMHWIKYMNSSASESIRNAYYNLERPRLPSREFRFESDFGKAQSTKLCMCPTHQ